MKRNLTTKDLAYCWKGIPRLDLSDIKDTRWLIDLFLAEGSIQLVYGPFGTRKTTAMLLAAWAVSQGTPFLGKKTRKRVVLYLDYENPVGVLKSYCRDLRIDASSSTFVIWDRSKQPLPVPGDNAKDETLNDFIRRCKEATGRSPWLIFDSWTSLLKSDASGDKISDAAPIFRQIREYRDSGATCTIIDHTGKNRKKEPIGTSAKMTQMDSAHAFHIEQQETNLTRDSSRAVIRVEAFLKRYAPQDIGTFSFEVSSAVDTKGAWHLRSLETAKDKAERLLERQIEDLRQTILANPSLGQEELAALAARDKSMGKNRASKLLQEGIGIHWKSIAKGSRKRIFRLLKASEIAIP
jgi:hypothetical protein